jgi:hypothetical protein
MRLSAINFVKGLWNMVVKEMMKLSRKPQEEYWAEFLLD